MLDDNDAIDPDRQTVTLFENVVAEYDRGRPSYPDAVYDALGPLDGMRVVEVGAGTGIATRQLLHRGAQVIAVDAGPAMLAQAKARTPALPALVADGARLPLRDGCTELVCLAQAWHWLDPSTRVAEMQRVLAPGGRLAAWWSHAEVTDDAWFDAYWTTLERACEGTHRSQAETDWASTFAPLKPEAHELRWTRQVSIDDWLTDQASHSYVATMPDALRQQLLHELRGIVEDEFTDGTMRVPFVTRLWVATTQAGTGSAPA